MDSDDDDSFFSRNLRGGGNPAPDPARNRRQPAIPAPPASPNPFGVDPDFDIDGLAGGSDNNDNAETPLQQLIRHWMNERHAPDILPVQQALLTALLDHIRRQVRFDLCSIFNRARI